MAIRDVDSYAPPGPPFGDLVLRAPPNLTAVAFFGLLGGLHLAISIPTLIGGRWEGYLSLIFGTVFAIVSALAWRLRFEVAVLPSQRRVRLRYGRGRVSVERFIPFAAVRGVRLTLSNGPAHPEAQVELLCPYEDVLCPPTHIPRQQALFLAMAMNVPLTKVTDEPSPPEGQSAAPELAERRF